MQETAVFLIFGLFIITCALAVALWQSRKTCHALLSAYRQMEQQMTQLAEEHHHLEQESQTQQAALAQNTIEHTRQLAIEEERNRIARDIHDTVTQSLFGLSFSLDACRKLLPAQGEIVKEELGELAQLVTQVRGQVRQSILDIWPSTLTQVQFQDDLEKYISQYTLARGFRMEFTIEGDFDGLPAVIRRNLYRVCQESLSNAARHSGAELARVYVTVEPTEVHLSIRDKGKGFDTKSALARVNDRERFGLRGIQERIKSLGGTCDILSETGQGTQVIVRVPVQKQ